MVQTKTTQTDFDIVKSCVYLPPKRHRQLTKKTPAWLSPPGSNQKTAAEAWRDMVLEMLENKWYVIRSKPNMEKFLAGQLESRQIPFYLPQLTAKPKNPRCRKTRPFFPGYLFIHSKEVVGEEAALNHLPGAIGLVAFGDENAFVPETILNAIRQKVEQMNLVEENPCCRLEKGDRLIINSGPFAGYEAIFDSQSGGRERARVFLTMVEKRMLEVEVPAAYLA